MSVEKLFNEMHSKHLLTEIHLRYFVDCVCRVCVRVRIIHRLTLFYVARYFVNYIEIYIVCYEQFGTNLRIITVIEDKAPFYWSV